LSTPIVWAGVAVCATAIFVQTTHSGVDVLVVLVAGFALLVLERTLGDWIADTLGSGPAALIFAGMALAGLLYVDSGSGRATAARFFAGAQARGYGAAYVSLTPSGKVAEVPDLHVPPPSSSVSPRGAPAPGGPAVLQVSPPTSTASAAPAPPPPAAGVRITQVRLSADVVTVGQSIALHADVAADDDGELPPVEFSIDGRVIATAASTGGRATATWSTRIPGQYVVRARLPGRFSGSGRSARITVLPGRVPQPRRQTASE
jgi:hypothetical protein